MTSFWPWYVAMIFWNLKLMICLSGCRSTGDAILFYAIIDETKLTEVFGTKRCWRAAKIVQISRSFYRRDLSKWPQSKWLRFFMPPCSWMYLCIPCTVDTVNKDVIMSTTRFIKLITSLREIFSLFSLHHQAWVKWLNVMLLSIYILNYLNAV